MGWWCWGGGCGRGPVLSGEGQAWRSEALGFLFPGWQLQGMGLLATLWSSHSGDWPGLSSCTLNREVHGPREPAEMWPPDVSHNYRARVLCALDGQPPEPQALWGTWGPSPPSISLVKGRVVPCTWTRGLTPRPAPKADPLAFDTDGRDDKGSLRQVLCLPCASEVGAQGTLPAGVAIPKAVARMALPAAYVLSIAKRRKVEHISPFSQPKCLPWVGPSGDPTVFPALLQCCTLTSLCPRRVSGSVSRSVRWSLLLGHRGPHPGVWE